MMIKKDYGAKWLPKYNWDCLCCHDRALSIVFDELNYGSSLHTLLLKMRNSNMLKDNRDLAIGAPVYYERISRNCGIELKRYSIEAADFVNCILKLLKEGKNLVCTTNNAWQPGSMHYQKKSHLHFMILIDYDAGKDGFIIYDEDETKQYWNNADKDDGVKFCTKHISRRLFLDLCLHMKNCDDLFYPEKWTDPDEYAVVYTVQKVRDVKFTLQEIYDQNMEQLKDMIVYQQQHEEYVYEQFSIYQRDFLNRKLPELDKTMNEEYLLELNNPLGMKRRIFFPDECALFLSHSRFLQIQKRTLQLLIQKNDRVEDTQKRISVLLNDYLDLRNTIAKAVLKRDVAYLNTAWEKFTALWQKECGLYLYMIQNKNEFIFVEEK